MPTEFDPALGAGTGVDEALAAASPAPAGAEGTPAIPAPLAVRLDTIPATLKAHPRWALVEFKLQPEKGKYTKIPRSPVDPATGLSTNRLPWHTFEVVCAALPTAAMLYEAGVGFVMTRITGLVGIDLDRCVHDGQAEPWAAELVRRSGGYAERSPSGRGLRIFVRGRALEEGQNHAIGIEIYAGAEPRYLTVTGHRLDDSPVDVPDASPGFFEWLAQTHPMGRSKSSEPPPDLPELLPEDQLPAVESLNLPDRVSAFLRGTEPCPGGDRSQFLAGMTHSLYEALSPSEGPPADSAVLSLLVNSPAMAIAEEHRPRSDADAQTEAAVAYIWEHHCAKKRLVAKPPAADFPVIEVGAGEPPPLPAFERTHEGKSKPTAHNLDLALRRPDVCGRHLAFDTFLGAVMRSPSGIGGWAPFTDNDYQALRLELERSGARFNRIGLEDLRAAVALAAQSAEFDSAQVWLRGLEWDGRSRVATFLHDCFGANDTPYHRAVAMYLWTALAGRVLEPGIKADMVPVAVGAQGLRKSSVVSAIAPMPDHFLELDLSRREEDIAREMRGRLVVEMPELRGLRAKDHEHLKAFITRREETWVPKFKEFTSRYARRSVFVGTTNSEQFLTDDTGHRRWLPFSVGRLCDPDRVAHGRCQLWAEARELFLAGGIRWQDAERLARAEHDEFVVRDVWEEAVARWLDGPDDALADFEGQAGQVIRRVRDGFVTSERALREGVKVEPRNVTQAHKTRMGALLTALGGRGTKRWDGGRQVRGFHWLPEPSGGTAEGQA